MLPIRRPATLEALSPPVNLNARPARVVRRFRPFLESHPIKVVDVGARWGPTVELRPLLPHVEYLAIEADPDEAERLTEDLAGLGLRSARVVARAVGPRGKKGLHVAREPGRSSLLEPNDEVIARYFDADLFRTEKTIPIELTPLDAVLEEYDISEIDLLKLDVQGYELEVLRTMGKERLAATSMVETEVSFVEIYRGQSLFRDIDAFLAGAGFELFHLSRVFGNWGGTRGLPYGRGQMTFADAFYLRARGLGEDVARAARLAFLACYYGFNDYAYHLCRGHDRFTALPGEARAPFEAHFAEFDRAARGGAGARVAGAALRLLLDRALFRYLGWRRWNGLKSDTDRAYPVR